MATGAKKRRMQRRGEAVAAEQQRLALTRTGGAVAGAAAEAGPAPTWALSRERAIALAHRFWPIGVVLALFAVSAVIVPTMTAAPVSDDWVYARSVEILVRQHHLKILDLSVVTLVFQVAWGALFAEMFGMTFGALRLSTVVLTAFAGLAVYGICRELALSRGRSALGAAAFLFNPLGFVLAFSFMSDPQFAALLTIASYFYVRGLQPGAVGRRATWIGSGVAAAAFLVRQQGALIPLAVVIYLLISRRLRPNREGVWQFARVVAIPATATILYYVWLKFIYGIPVQQESFVNSIKAAGIGGSWLLIKRLTFIEAMYLGFFALPIAAGALLALARLVRFHSPLGWIMFNAWTALIVAGLAIFGRPGAWPARSLMPYIPQFFGPNGLGPGDLRGGRAPLDTTSLQHWFTGFCAAASLLLVLALCRNVRTPATRDRAGAGMLLTIGLWQVFGALPPSYHFRNWTVSVDRYLLPLLPFAICLGLWALRDVRLAIPLAWVVVAAFAILSVAGTRDFLVFQGATWDFAREANAMGIPNTSLDAGSSWGGYHLWEYSNANHISPRTPSPRPWWDNLFAPATDSSYIIAGNANQDGYTEITRYEYSSWLTGKSEYLYLLRRNNVEG